MPRGEKSARRYLWHEKNPTRRAIYRCFLSVLFSPSLLRLPIPLPGAPQAWRGSGELPNAFPHGLPSVPGLILPFDGL